MPLEGLQRPVTAEATHVDAHVRAAGGEGGVVLPVDVQGRRCVNSFIYLFLKAEHTVALMRRFLSAAGQGDVQKTTVFCIKQQVWSVPEWKGNCCLASPVCASQMIVV